MSDILTTISRLPFQVAVSMPDMPHEYTVRRKAPDDADYVALFDAIMNEGTVHWWLRKHARYLYPGDGYYYWSLASMHSDAEARHPLWMSTHINRARIETRDRYIATGALSLEQPTRPDKNYIRYPATQPEGFSPGYRPLPLPKRLQAP